MEILYTDDHLIACIKPVGLDAEHDLPTALREAVGGEIYTLHRLDRNVGGVMIYARTKAAAATLSKAIQDGAMVKEYLAMVHGVPEESGDLDDLLWKDSRQNKVFVVKRMRKGVKPARLTYRRLTDTDPSLIHIRLYTGRSHQIRVQFASRKHPLLGDHKYGARDDEVSPRLFSCRITLPFGGKTHRFSALPEWAKGVELSEME